MGNTRRKIRHHLPPSSGQCDPAQHLVLTASQTTCYNGRWGTLSAVAPSGESVTETASDLSAGQSTPTDSHLQLRTPVSKLS